MSVTTRTNPVAEVSARLPNGGMILHVYPEGDSRVVQATGELDLASRNQLFVASTAGNHPAMVIDLAAVTFMDCSGYGSVVASRLVVEREGRALTIRGQTGQPARLLDLIA
ncbi:MAG TPA: STAS domain-containing protein, partial [Ilumatobacteraceae bacterium]|nr:STAS domain-containing protein [Ilumatobacteraceae bacterium]